MAKQQKQWVFAPDKRRGKKPKVPTEQKTAIKEKADTEIVPKLRQTYISPPPEEPRFNYIEQIDTKWYRHYFYFFSIYCVPHPEAITPTFEAKFARMEYVSEDLFDLSFMRHNGEWVPLYGGLTMDECFELIMTETYFHP